MKIAKYFKYIDVRIDSLSRTDKFSHNYMKYRNPFWYTCQETGKVTVFAQLDDEYIEYKEFERNEIVQVFRLPKISNLDSYEMMKMMLNK